MKCDYIITAHDHPAVFPRDGEGERMMERGEKVWIVFKINPKIAANSYKKFNREARLISMPAFNDLILGSDFRENRSLNPLIRKRIFNRDSATIYGQRGTALNW